MTRNQQELEAKLLGQLRATKEDLIRWEEDPYYMDSATVYKFWDYIRKAPNIIIVGDYDADGISATYILGKSIKEQCPDKKLALRIPKRHAEGFGINMNIAEEIKEKLPKGSLVITVDNGIAAPDVLEDIKAAGYTVIITDHHDLKEDGRIPNVDMVLNPSVEGVDDAFDGKYWCGAAVAYKLCEQIITKDLRKELESIAGIASVADCMNLVEGNWGLVRRAIKSFRKLESPRSLNLLLEKMKQDPKFVNTDTFGFYLGPAFNAAGRLSDEGPNLILKYLFKPSDELADKIIDYNNQRKKLRDEEYKIIEQTIAEHNLQEAYPIVVYAPNLHEGIVGILAGKVTENYNAPAIVFTDSSEEGYIKGSARGVDGFNVFRYLCDNEDLMFKFGGHAGAGGLTILKDNLTELQKRQIKVERSSQNIIKESMFIDKEEIPDIIPIIEECMPFGEGNPVPYFTINIDIEADKAYFVNGKEPIGEDELGNPVFPKHLFVNNSMPEAGNYKITHFFHDPNELNDKNNFLAVGNIFRDGYTKKDTNTTYQFTTFNTEYIEDIHSDNLELDNIGGL